MYRTASATSKTLHTKNTSIRLRNRSDPDLVRTGTSQSRLMQSLLVRSSGGGRGDQDFDGSRQPRKTKNCCNKPRKWSLSSILLLTLVVASVSTVIINMVTVFVFSSKNSLDTKRHHQHQHHHEGGFLRESRTGRDPAIFSESLRRRKDKGLFSSNKKKDKKSLPTSRTSRVVYLQSAWSLGHDGTALAKQGRVIATMFPVEPVVNATNATSVPFNATALEMNMTNPDIIPKDEIVVTTSNASTVAQGDLSYLKQCVPKTEWQMTNFINCNAFHEVDMPHSSVEKSSHEEHLAVLGEGWFRTAWRWDASNQTTTVLKTLRIERDFLPEYYELHRRDAVAMERLTWSPFVVNVFGYCGNSAINEIADFPYKDVKDLEHFDRKMRYRERAPQIQRIKLQLAASVAQGVADIHSIDGPEAGVTMVHYDLNPRNIAIFKNGRPKINDFNIAEFLRYDPETNRTCGFPNRMKQPWWRAPEEVNQTANVEVTEKVDIYSLGAILFHILTTHSPRGKMKQELMEGIRADVVRGIAPVLPPPFDTMTDPVTMAFKKAMDRCFVVDPKERATADEIVDILFQALVNILGERAKKTVRASSKHKGNLTNRA